MYAPFPSVNKDAPQTCTGETSSYSWCGHGQIDALKDVAD
jgi:hypothetical protein